MKHIRILCCCALVALSAGPLNASSITAYNNQTAYVTTNHVFRNNEVAQGFVRLNEGFTVMPHSCVTMDVVLSVSGDIDLRETSTIRLLKDLKFDSGVTLTTGGNIDGRGYTLILNGDFRIPAGKVLHFNGDTIIDAHGHEIVIGENAEIFVDTNVTLTIANAVIKSLRNAPTYPAIRCSALTSKLALDNVIFAPADDFLFQSGQLFVHNDVVITGTLAFVYHSPVPSFITQNSCLYFDHDVTFSLAPATFTDAPYALKNTYTDCNFIRMADETASLFFDGCTVQITDTGFHFAQGTLTLDDRVAIKTDPTLTLTSLSLRDQLFVGESGTQSSAWSPDGRYVAFCPHGLGIYRFNGTSLSQIILVGPNPTSVSWSPDGRYLSCSFVTGTIIYAFDGTSVQDVVHVSPGYVVHSEWSHDGKFLAINYIDGTLRIYAFDGSSLSLVAQEIAQPSPYSSAWSPDDQYIITGSLYAEFSPARLYRFDGKNLALVLTIDPSSPDSFFYNASWSPDGRYVAINWADRIIIYRFDGVSVMAVTDLEALIYWVDWSPDGNYIAAIESSPNRVEVFKFDTESLSLIPATQMVFHDEPGSLPSFTQWRFDGKFLAAVSYLDGIFRIYTADYTQTTTSQALTNSFVLGDSAKGENYDAHLRLQPGASLNVTGKMLYDNVN